MFQLPFNFKQQKKPSKFLTIDIGSNEVKVIAFNVVTQDGHLTPKASVLGIAKKEILPETTRSGSITDSNDVIQALKTAITQASPEDETIKDAVFGVSGILGTGFMITVKVGRKSTSQISKKELQNNFEKIHEEAYDIAQGIFRDMTGLEDLDLKMITSSVVYAKLDGHLMDDLEGKTGRKLEIAVYTAFTPTYHFNTIHDIASKLGLNLIAIAPTTYSLAKALSYSKGADYDAVLIDVGGDITDVAVVFGGGIVASRSIEIGGNHFTRAIEKGMLLPPREAELRKISYSFERLNESDEMLVQGHIDNLLDIWLHGLDVVFSDFTGVKMFSSNVYVAGGGIILPDLFEVLSKEPWAKSVPFKSPPEFSKLSIDDLKLVEDMSGNSYSLEYIIPAALSIVYLEAKGLID
ncbi:rod shape-determining protein [candidate division WWE3 bacterium]|nr:rod shape-determining protein [candidate division WWE3 bacterium]